MGAVSHYVVPPIHSIIFIAALAAFMSTASSLATSNIDGNQPSADMFSHRIFPETVSVRILATIRFAFGAWVFGNSINAMMSSWVQETNYLADSQLQKSSIIFSGIYTQLQFSGMSWNLWGASCFLSGYLTLYGDTSSQELLNLGLFVFEAAAPSALLVTFCVSHVIWPNLLKANIPTTDLKRPAALFVHNTNICMVLTEMALLGGLPMKWFHFSLSTLFGVAYIIFSWTMQNKWPQQEQDKTPQFIYFFLDPTLGWTSTLFILCLLGTMLFFHFSFCMVQHFLNEHVGSSILLHSCFVLTCCFGLCRVRD